MARKVQRQVQRDTTTTHLCIMPPMNRRTYHLLQSIWLAGAAMAHAQHIANH
jgi:hypothetical protein